MKPHPRIRKTVKWGGLAVTVVLLSVWIGSIWWGVTYGLPSRRDISISNGGVSVNWYSPPPPKPAPLPLGSFDFEIQITYPRGFTVERVFFPPHWLPYSSNVTGNRSVFAPLWPVVLACAAAAAFAWRLDTLARRRAELNRCLACGYDRTGLAAGSVCPECGAGGGAAAGDR